MTKAEKERVETLERDLAFRWPTMPEPTRMPKPSSGGEIEGWDYNAHSRSVERYWSRSVSHGRFYRDKRMSGSQGGRAIYATEAEALLALRWELCRQYAYQLRDIDLRLAATTPLPEAEKG